jgi:hypothetical protein
MHLFIGSMEMGDHRSVQINPLLIAQEKQSYKLQGHLSLQIDYEDKYCY